MYPLAAHQMRRIGALTSTLRLRLCLLCPNTIEAEPFPDLLSGTSASLSLGPQVIPSPVTCVLLPMHVLTDRCHLISFV